MFILDFVKSHFVVIIVVAVLVTVFFLFFYLTTLSIKKLKVSVFPTYPFDLFFPNERSWSAGFFLIIVLILGLLVFLLYKGGFYGEIISTGGPA